MLPPSDGRVVLGSRVVPGLFTQVNDRPDFLGRTAGEIVEERAGNHEATMKHLARYGLERTARQRYETLSGGQKARLEVLALELAGQNLLLLDEPTDNLDIESSEALEIRPRRLRGHGRLGLPRPHLPRGPGPVLAPRHRRGHDRAGRLAQRATTPSSPVGWPRRPGRSLRSEG